MANIVNITSNSDSLTELGRDALIYIRFGLHYGSDMTVLLLGEHEMTSSNKKLSFYYVSVKIVLTKQRLFQQHYVYKKIYYIYMCYSL